jgi:hypothetical protein
VAILVNISLNYLKIKGRAAAILNWEILKFSLKNMKTTAFCCFLMKIGHFG